MAKWKDDIIQALNELGGQAVYADLYPVIERIRINSGHKLTDKWKQTVQGTIEENSPDSLKFKEGREAVFYSVSGLGKGTWALFQKFLTEESVVNEDFQYGQGIEGIQKEAVYLRRSRDPRLVEERKRLDDFTCQVCSYRKEIEGKFIIDVHHLWPLGALNSVVITSISDLICLCPNCHRAAHAGKEAPITVGILRRLISATNIFPTT